MTTRQFVHNPIHPFLMKIGGILLVAFALLLLTVRFASAQERLPGETIDRVAQSVVMIVAIENGEEISSGSGTIVSAEGRIYTNRHVVSEGDDFAIYMLDDINEPTALRYYASVVTWSSNLDFAVMQIDRDAHRQRIDASELALAFLDPAQLKPASVPIRGDDVFVFGYPGISENYLAFVHGNITSIQNGDVGDEHLPVWYQTDAEIGPGNSGGLAVNANGDLIGIPTNVNFDDQTGARFGGLLSFAAVLQLIDSGELNLGTTGAPSRIGRPSRPGAPGGNNPGTQLGAEPVNIACTNHAVAVENGTSITILQMRPGFSYTVTALGVGDFDPVLVVSTTNGRNMTCSDNSRAAASYSANLPDMGAVRGNDHSAQVTFVPPPVNDLVDMQVSIGGKDGMSGEVILMFEGMGVTSYDGAGDPFEVLLTNRVANSRASVTAYLIGLDDALDPIIDTADPDMKNYLEDPNGAIIYCDDAGDPQYCWGRTRSMATASVTLGSRTVHGDAYDSIVSINPIDILGDRMESVIFLMTKTEDSASGQYLLLFHLGLA